MLKRIRTLTSGPSSRLRPASDGDVIARKTIPAIRAYTNHRKVFFVLSFLFLLPVDMFRPGKATAADPNLRGPIIFLQQPDATGLDRELFTSNGSNRSEVFDVGSYRQANFRLAQSGDASL